MECDPERTYSIDEFPEPKTGATQKRIQPAEAEAFQSSGQVETPCRKTLEFIQRGAGKGERRTSLFVAACDLSGCGWLKSQAEAVLLPQALGLRRSDEDADEWRSRCEEQITNAFSRPRLPAREAARLRNGGPIAQPARPTNGKPKVDMGPYTITLPTGTQCTFKRRPVKKAHQ